MTTSGPTTVPLVLRDHVAAALAAQTAPVTAAQLAARLVPHIASGANQIRKVLVELEAAGAARREYGSRHQPGGRLPDLWSASGSS